MSSDYMSAEKKKCSDYTCLVDNLSPKAATPFTQNMPPAYPFFYINRPYFRLGCFTTISHNLSGENSSN